MSKAFTEDWEGLWNICTRLQGWYNRNSIKTPGAPPWPELPPLPTVPGVEDMNTHELTNTGFTFLETSPAWRLDTETSAIGGVMAARWYDTNGSGVQDIDEFLSALQTWIDDFKDTLAEGAEMAEEGEAIDWEGLAQIIADLLAFVLGMRRWRNRGGRK